MSKSVIFYIILLLLLCAGSFWLGTQQKEIVESVKTVVELDTVFINAPAPPSNVTPAEPKIVYLTEYKTDTVTNTIVKTERDSVMVYVPISDYTFEKDSLYKITARGYDVRLTAVELYNLNTTTTATLRAPTQHWSVNASLTSQFAKDMASLYLGANVAYQTNGWTFKGGYQFGLDGSGAVMIGVEKKIFGF